MQAPKVCQKYRKLPLRSRRGPAAKDWRYRNRVGIKADSLRKAATAEQILKDATNRLRLKVDNKGEDVPNTSVPSKLKSSATRTGMKRKRCGDCDGCQAANCGECTNCLDKKIFGGPGIKKQCCMRRRCLTFLTPLQQLSQRILSSNENVEKETDAYHVDDTVGDTENWVDVMKQDWYVLSKKQKEEVYKIWNNAKKKTLTVLPSGLSLNDVWSLFLTHWLTDKVITTFLQIALQKYSNDTRRTFVALTFLCNSLNRHSEVTRRWYQKVNFQEYNVCLFPVHVHNNHWILLALHIADKELLVYDSLGRTQYSCVEALKGWILEKKEIITEWDDVNFRYIPEKEVPRQQNGHDCGVFLCVYALHEMLGIKTYNCNAGNFNHIREWMTWMLFNTH
ncbi:sentrin-specific protease 1-like [Dysidea avara]|uniref:sentrin-specific protease 1-like n=1 Tax=Dysidea avara TaxID=196820 RepID=UPI00332312D3